MKWEMNEKGKKTKNKCEQKIACSDEDEVNGAARAIHLYMYAVRWMCVCVCLNVVVWKTYKREKMISILCQPHDVSYQSSTHQKKSTYHHHAPPVAVTSEKNTSRSRALLILLPTVTAVATGLICHIILRCWYLCTLAFLKCFRLFWLTALTQTQRMKNYFISNRSVHRIKFIWCASRTILVAKLSSERTPNILSIEFSYRSSNCRTRISDEMQTMEWNGGKERNQSKLHSIWVQHCNTHNMHSSPDAPLQPSSSSSTMICHQRCYAYAFVLLATRCSSSSHVCIYIYTYGDDERYRRYFEFISV